MNTFVVGEKSFVGDYNIEKLFKNNFDEKDLVKIILKIINPEKEFKIEFEKFLIHDVQKRIPNNSKVRKLVNFREKIPISKSLGIIIPWIKEQIFFNEI
jgi:hypothetical protein